MRTLIIGIVFTILVGFKMHHGTTWDAGAGKVPKAIMADYFKLAYDEGKGAEADKLYYAKDAADQVINAIERQDGAPIPHQVISVTGAGMEVVVHQKIPATRGQQAVEVVDFYKFKGSRIKERNRVTQTIAQ